MTAMPLESADQLASESLQLIAKYWFAKAGARCCPRTNEIDLLELAPFAGKLMLLDVEPGPSFRFRMIGNEVAERYQSDVTGELISALPGTAFVAGIERLLHRVQDEERGYRHSPRASAFPGKEHILIEFIVLPFAGESGHVEQILAAMEFPAEVS